MRNHLKTAVTYDTIYKLVHRIPKGRVATYGQIAHLAGIPGQPRRVGYALAGLRDGSSVPWHRVINAKGEISLRPGNGDEKQRRLLEREGVVFDAKGRIPLEQFRWEAKRTGRQP